MNKCEYSYLLWCYYIGTSAPSSQCLCGYLCVASVYHSCRHAVPHIGHGVIAYVETQTCELLVELGKAVVQLPKGVALFCSCQHILVASFGNGLFKRGIYCDKFSGCFDIEVVHAHRCYYALGIGGYGFSQRAKVDEEPHAIIV